MKTLLLLAVFLAGCAPQIDNVDIDVKCAKDKLWSAEENASGIVIGRVYDCSKEYGDEFSIVCKRDTISVVNDSILCSTIDGSKVRIQQK